MWRNTRRLFTPGTLRMPNVTWLEWVVISLSLGLLLAYHLWLLVRLRQKPLRTAIGLTQHVRRLWVESIVQERRDILAVQTLRNWIMAASLLASTAIVITLVQRFVSSC